MTKSEERLEAIRAEAERTGRVSAIGIRPRGAPLPQADSSSGYYGVPMLKPPVWTWEIPAYFFVGGAAGAAAVIGFASRVAGGDEALTREARWLAAIGANLSAPLLITDLGRPERFLAMMRVFKPQSPMSVGAWIVAAFGGSATGAVVFSGLLADAAAAVSAVAGLGMATYTGVLLGVTAIPLWARNARLLPIHFGASGVASAVSILELRGHDAEALNVMALAATAYETLTGASIELRRDRQSEPLRHGPSGTLTRAGGVLSGPVPLLLRLFGGRSKRARRLAAASSIVGSLITRFAWLEAGKASANDPVVALQGNLNGTHAVGSPETDRKSSGGPARPAAPVSQA